MPVTFDIKFHSFLLSSGFMIVSITTYGPVIR